MLPLVMERRVSILHMAAGAETCLGCSVCGVHSRPPQCRDAGRVPLCCPVALLGMRAARQPLRAPECPRAAWVSPQPCPRRQRGPGRRIGHLPREAFRRAPLMLLSASLSQANPLVWGVPGKAAPVLELRPHPSHPGSCPRTSGCRCAPGCPRSSSAAASASRTTAQPLHPSLLAQLPAGSWWGPPARSSGGQVSLCPAQRLRGFLCKRSRSWSRTRDEQEKPEPEVGTIRVAKSPQGSQGCLRASRETWGGESQLISGDKAGAGFYEP